MTLSMDISMKNNSNFAVVLDRHGIPWKQIIMTFGIGQYILETYLSIRQHRKLCETAPPKTLEGVVSNDEFDKSQAYGRAKSRYSFLSSLYAQMQNILIIKWDLLPKLWDLVGIFVEEYDTVGLSGEISQSILFFASFSCIISIVSLPLSYYKTFFLEEKFGFNKQTRRLFFVDWIKMQTLILCIGSPILACFLKIVQAFGNKFFYYLWVFVLSLQVFMITIYPTAILPLFNRLTPLKEGKLKSEVEALAKRLNFPLKQLYVIDGSKRSAHSNAYFYGLPWSKQIVIYDTLIEKSEVNEVVAILAHELGHWSESHTIKLFSITQIHTFWLFALFSAFITNHSLYQAFGFSRVQPVIVGFLIFQHILIPLDTIIKLGMNILSRKFEFEADRFAVRLGYAKELSKSLIKLQVQNLSTMDADWMYSSYHYTHPILSERLRKLDWKGGKVE